MTSKRELLKSDYKNKKGNIYNEIVRRYDNEPIKLDDFSAITLHKDNIISCISDRRSIRKYADEKLSIRELSYLLWSTQGVTKMLKSGKSLRTVPSADKAHPFETYLIIQNIENTENGLYKYLYLTHEILPLTKDTIKIDYIIDACANQSFVKTSAVIFLWSCVPERSEKIKTMVSCHKSILLDAGHVCQNLYLAGESINCGVCAIAAYDQDMIDELIGLDKDNEFVVYIASVGKKQISR